MELLGLESGFSFDYHYYGPFSRDLDNAIADAKAFHVVEELIERRQTDGAAYSIFKLSGEPNPTAYGKLGAAKAAELARLFTATNVTVLELAATVDWLWRKEKYSDWRTEIMKRKGVKVRAGRLDQAIALLEKLGLKPPAVPMESR
jgi:predicted negative regulator of RcsB-dependent stress response